MIRSLLNAKQPYCGGDISDLCHEQKTQLTDTGLPPDAVCNLLFHAALRLVNSGQLIVRKEKNTEEYYG